jgi:hypothetical protein
VSQTKAMPPRSFHPSRPHRSCDLLRRPNTRGSHARIGKRVPQEAERSDPNAQQAAPVRHWDCPSKPACGRRHVIRATEYVDAQEGAEHVAMEPNPTAASAVATVRHRQARIIPTAAITTNGPRVWRMCTAYSNFVAPSCSVPMPVLVRLKQEYPDEPSTLQETLAPRMVQKQETGQVFHLQP